MSFEQYQKQVHAWASQFKKPYFKPLEQRDKLLEEVREVCEIIEDVYGPGGSGRYTEEQRKALADELADVAFVINCIANREGIDMEDSWQRMMERRYDRDNERFEKKE